MGEVGTATRSTAGERRAWARLVAVAALVLAALYLWAGYVEGWAWTGLSGDVTLWDWLEAVALPLTVGLLPLVLLHRHRLSHGHAARS